MEVLYQLSYNGLDEMYWRDHSVAEKLTFGNPRLAVPVLQSEQVRRNAGRA